MYAKKIHIAVNLRHNGSVSRGEMQGLGYLDSGFLVGKFEGFDGAWTESEKLILCAFTFTGCPIAARTATPSLNPWRWTNGSYESSRTATLAGAEIASTLVSKGESDAISMNLSLSVQGQLPKISSVQRPFQEAITQRALGKLQGKFAIEFEGADGDVIRLDAATTYSLAIDRDVPDSWRNITISANDLNANGMTQIEQIDLFHDERDAARDLTEKCAVWRA